MICSLTTSNCGQTEPTYPNHELQSRSASVAFIGYQNAQIFTVSFHENFCFWTSIFYFIVYHFLGPSLLVFEGTLCVLGWLGCWIFLPFFFMWSWIEFTFILWDGTCLETSGNELRGMRQRQTFFKICEKSIFWVFFFLSWLVENVLKHSFVFRI